MHKASNAEDLISQTNASTTNRNQIVLSEYTTLPGFANRRAVTRYSWFELGEPSKVPPDGHHSAFAIAFEPSRCTDGNNVSSPPFSGFTKTSIEATQFGLYLFEQVAPRITKMSLVQNVDLGGSIPGWVMNSLVAVALAFVIRIQDKFRRRDRVVDKVCSTNHGGDASTSS